MKPSDKQQVIKGEYLCPSAYKEGDILILVRIPLELA